MDLESVFFFLKRRWIVFMFVCGVIGCCLIMRIAEPWEGNVVRANPQVIAKLQKIMVMSAYVCKKFLH